MITLERLIAEAKRAAQLSYSPYSNFKVGACVEVNGDMWYSGTNVENASYGLTICAERVAIVKAVSHGHTKLKRVIVYGPSQEVRTAPCGACRQFIKEFANEETRIHCVCNTDSTMVFTMEELLPKAFGPENLLRKLKETAVQKPEDTAKGCYSFGQFPYPDHKPFCNQVEKKPEQFTKKCIYCQNKGFFRDDLSGGESYCTCAVGMSLKKVEIE